MNKVLIFGCGPAGLMAAHAAVEQGFDPVIYSRKRKSPMRGAMYLHSKLPGLPAYEFKITYGLIGGVDGYRAKVYGAESGIQVSPETLVGVTKAWDIRTVYDALWDTYKNCITEFDVHYESVFDASAIVQPTAIVSTVPAHLLCKGGCEFLSTRVWISEGADYISPLDDNIVVCSGNENHRWYRQSRILRWENTEYPNRSFLGVTPGDRTITAVIKPISTDCRCHPNVYRAGRYGKWEKKVLSDSSYYETKELLKKWQ